MVLLRGLVCVSLLSALAAGCEKDDDKKSAPGASLGIPALTPPITGSVPEGMKSGGSLGLTQGNEGLSSKACQAPDSDAKGFGTESAECYIATIHDRFFQEGPTSLEGMAESTDNRLAEIETQALESARVCVTEEPKDWQVTGLPGIDAGITLKIQCKYEFESNGSKYKILFGKDTAGKSYIFEGGVHTGWSRMTFATIDATGDDLDLWVFSATDQTSGMQQQSNVGSVSHVKANKATKKIQMSHGGDDAGTGVSCGVRVHSDGTNLFGNGEFKAPGTQGGYECGTNEISLCINASTLLTAEDSACAALDSFAVEPLTYVDLQPTGIYAQITAFAAAPGAPEVTDFNIGVIPEGE